MENENIVKIVTKFGCYKQENPLFYHKFKDFMISGLKLYSKSSGGSTRLKNENPAIKTTQEEFNKDKKKYLQNSEGMKKIFSTPERKHNSDKFLPLKDRAKFYGLPFPSLLLHDKTKEEFKNDEKCLLFYLAIADYHLVFFRYYKQANFWNGIKFVGIPKPSNFYKTRFNRRNEYVFDRFFFEVQQDDRDIVKKFKHLYLTPFIYRMENRRNQCHIKLPENYFYPKKPFLDDPDNNYYHLYYTTTSQCIVYERIMPDT